MISFVLRRRVCASLLAATFAATAVTASINAALLALPAPAQISSGDGQPTLFPFLPTAELNNGAAVLIVPRKPLDTLDRDGESVQLARWLNTRGISGFVLRYSDQSGDSASSVAAVHRAVRFIRANATEFKLSPRRVAVLGFAHGAELAADSAYHPLNGNPAANDPVERFSSRPDLLALIWGAPASDSLPENCPPTFLAASTRTSDGMTPMIDLWTKLVAAKASVDAHFFSDLVAQSNSPAANASPGSWTESLFHWSRFNGLLTDESRLPIKGMVSLDGRVLPQGYVIFTPLDRVGTGPVIGRVLNSNPAIPIGQFSLPAEQGPIAGRYRVEVRQNMNRWLGNSFSSDLVRPSGAATPEQIYFGHHRLLTPTLGDQRAFTKVRPSDSSDYIVEFKPGAGSNLELKIELFSQ